MLTIHTDTKIHKMSENNPPVAKAKSGDTVCFETLDCFGGQLKSENDLLGGLDWNNVNPASGPLFVEDATPGDVLKVEILKIELDDHGVMVDAPGEGVTGAAVSSESTKILPVKNGKVKFNEKLSFPICPMIGVIGTAAKGEGIDTGTPGSHGGNMDCTRIGEGATLYLPVNTEGALLAMGDLHARMGDGEVEVCGVEIAGKVTVKLTVLKNCKLPTPFLVNSELAMAIHSAETVDEACVGATMAMHGFLTGELGMNEHEAGMLLSVTGNLCICQVVDPEKTVRMEIPLSVTKAYGYEFE
ncbi:MAG: acetamidase/formamidase family protein [Oscillospiraceae bacterium]|nr:acetamidase/formamidase family protein [Oscillospiraceae bacterium]MBQ5323163.1 acetamidase/formamidase family protein [Oscillospiraceae bacterium]MBQ8594883.1 acetamidase/formamidase family protein [Oscillospiraceae bacterium]